MLYKAINLYKVLSLIWCERLKIALVVFVSLLFGIFYCYKIPKIYQVTVPIELSTQVGISLNNRNYNLPVIDIIKLQQILDSAPVQQYILSQLDLKKHYQVASDQDAISILSSRVKLIANPGGNYMLSVLDQDPLIAAKITTVYLTKINTVFLSSNNCENTIESYSYFKSLVMQLEERNNYLEQEIRRSPGALNNYPPIQFDILVQQGFLESQLQVMSQFNLPGVEKKKIKEQLVYLDKLNKNIQQKMGKSNNINTTDPRIKQRINMMLIAMYSSALNNAYDNSVSSCLDIPVLTMPAKIQLPDSPLYPQKKLIIFSCLFLSFFIMVALLLILHRKELVE